jgi:hypothetical protein
MSASTTATMKHTRTIERDANGFYCYSCACRTVYRGGMDTWTDARGEELAHKAAVADGTWQAEQEAEATRAAAAAPLNAAISAHTNMVDDYRSLGFEMVIERQRGNDVTALREQREQLGRRIVAAEAEVARLRAA